MARGKPHETLSIVGVPVKAAPVLVAKSEPPFPERPKPPLETPKPVFDSVASTAAAAPLVGELPHLPSATVESGPIEPLVPVAPTTHLPVADLNADEALARRVVLGVGGEVVSSADARDSTGKVGRSLVVETTPHGLARLQTALRKALGDRAVMSEAGSVGGSSPEIRKAEDALAVQKKQLDRARVDFLPKAPILQDLEDTYRTAERNLADARRATARQRLNVLLRPVLEG